MLTNRTAMIFLSIAAMWMAPRATNGQSAKIATSGTSDAEQVLNTAITEELSDLIVVPETDVDVKEVIALAIKSANQIPPHTDQQTQAQLAIALLQARTGDVTGASSTLASIEQLENLGPEARTAFQGIIFALAHEDSKAIQIAAQLKNDNITALISFGQASRRAFPAAVATANSIKSSSIKSSALKEIAAFQASTGDIQGALHLSSTIPDSAGYQNFAYFLIVKEQVKRNDLRGAIQTASKMRFGELTFALSAIASAQVKAGDIRAAMQTANSALHPGAGAQEDGQSTWAIVIGSICEAQSETGDVKGALETASRLDILSRPFDSYKSEALAAIAAARARKGDMVAVPHLLDTARKAVAGTRYNEGSTISYSLSDIAKAAVAKGDLVLALHAATIVPDGQGRLMVLRTIAEAEAKSGDVQKAMRSANYTQDPIGRSIILEATAMGQAESGDINGALRTASQIPDLGVRSEVTFLLMMARANAKDVNGVIALSSKQDSPYVATAAYVALARNLAYPGTRKPADVGATSITQSLQAPNQ